MRASMDASTAPPSGPSPPREPVPGRSCGACTLCCKTVAVQALGKAGGVWCRHAVRAKGCAIYETRPASCRSFNCEWLLREALGPEWKPDRAKFTLLVTPEQHLTACVDPGFPAAWRQAPYYENLRHWARQCADDPAGRWPGVNVWIGQRCIVILKDREVDLGVVAADEEVQIERRETATGPVCEAVKGKRAG